MNTKLHRKLKTRWIAFGSVLTTSFLLAAASAIADTPVKTPFSYTADAVLTDVLPFPVNIHSVVSGFEIAYLDQNGAVTKIYVHQDEQDTFSANGRTLVGLPFTFNIEVFFDSDGNLVGEISDGVVEKIRLPDGTLFISAGKVDFAAHGFGFVISADKGNPGNLDALTAALSP